MSKNNSTGSGRRPKRADIIGKRIDRVLRTEWDQDERYSYCEFFLQFTDGTFVKLEFFGELTLIDPKAVETPILVDIHCEPDFPALWTDGGFSGAGTTIEKVLVDDQREENGDIYLVLSGGHYMRPVCEEGQTALGLCDADYFVKTFNWLDLFDYWTRESAIAC